MTAVIDLSRLPAPAVVEALDFETILAAMKTDLLSRDPALDASSLESDPSAKILEVCAYRELLLRQRVNDAARAVMLAYSSGADLDHLGAGRETERLDGESDSAFRARIQGAYYRTAAAGPAGAYRQISLAAHASVVDVSVTSLADGQVTVTVLAWHLVDEGQADATAVAQGRAAFPGIAAPAGQVVIIAPAGSAPLLAVQAALNDEFARPLTDAVVVRPPEVRPFTVESTLVLYPGPDSAPVLAESTGDLAAYLASVRRIGYDVTLAGLLDALVVAGVQNVRLAAPTADLIVGPTQLALCLGVAIQTAEGRTQ